MSNMMNDDHKASNAKSRKGYDSTFTFSKRNKKDVNEYLEKHPGMEKYIYESVGAIEKYFGYNTKVILEVIFLHNKSKVSSNLTGHIQITCEIEKMNEHIESLGEFYNKRNDDFIDTFDWNIDFAD